MDKFREALDTLIYACYEAGERDADNGDGDSLLDECVIAAEAAVLALYEEQKSITDDLAKALRYEMDDLLCKDCQAPIATSLDCDAVCLRKSGAARDALADYNKAKGEKL